MMIELQEANKMFVYSFDPELSTKLQAQGHKKITEGKTGEKKFSIFELKGNFDFSNEKENESYVITSRMFF